MKTIIFFDLSTFAAAAIKTLRLKPGFLLKKLTVLRSLGEKPGLRQCNFWSSYSACKYGGCRSTLRKTKKPDSLSSSLELIGNQSSQ